MGLASIRPRERDQAQESRSEEADGRKAHPISVKRRRVEWTEEVARAGSQGDRQGRPYQETPRDGTGPCSGTGDPGGRPAGRLSACHHHHTWTPMGWTQGPSLLNFAIDDLAAEDGCLHAVLWHLLLRDVENIFAQHNGVAELTGGQRALALLLGSRVGRAKRVAP